MTIESGSFFDLPFSYLNRMKRILVILLVSVGYLASAQFELQNIVCSEHLGNEEGKRAIQLNDGGWLWTGEVESLKMGLQVIVVRLDSVLNVLWSREYGGEDYEFAQDLFQDDDNSLWMAGYTTSYGKGRREYYILHLSERGDVLGEYTYGTAGDDAATFIRPFNKNLLIGGLSYGETGRDPQNYFLIIDRNGKVINEIIFGDRGAEALWDAVSLSDGSWLMTGQTTTTVNGEKDVYLVKMDDGGTVIWEKQFGDLGDDRSFRIKQWRDKFIIVGFSTSQSPGIRNGYVLCVDANGEKLWETYLPYDRDLELFGIEALPHRILVTGYLFSSLTSEDMVVFELSPSGDINDAYTLDANLNQRGRDIFVLDESVLVFGHKFGANDDDLTFFDLSLRSLSVPSHQTTYSVWPNPTTGMLWIDGLEQEQWQLFNIAGDLILSGTKAVDISSAPIGVYILSVMSQGEIVNHKIYKY